MYSWLDTTTSFSISKMSDSGIDEPRTNAMLDPRPRTSETASAVPNRRSSRSVAGAGLAIRRVRKPQLPTSAPRLTARLDTISQMIALGPTGSPGAKMRGSMPAKHHHSGKNAEGWSQVPDIARIDAAHPIRTTDKASAPALTINVSLVAILV